MTGKTNPIPQGLLRSSELQPVLEKAKKAGIGLVGMKAGRFIAGRAWLGWGNPDAFDKYYDEKLLKAKLSAFQRSCASFWKMAST